MKKFNENFKQHTLTDFIREIPKAELHVHLDGSLRLSTLIDLARDRGLTLPSYTEEGLKELIFKPAYRGLKDYLAGFSWTVKVLQDREALEEAAYELAWDNFAEGVRYLEVRFAPQLHAHPGFTIEMAAEAVDRGLRRAGEEINHPLTPDEPLFEYGIILCTLRSSPASVSGELAREAIRLRQESSIRLSGFDLAGNEAAVSAAVHAEAFHSLDGTALGKTVHAGETSGPLSIFEAVMDLKAHRIGHGLHLFDTPRVPDLVRHIAKQKICIEVCLTSNLQTNPQLGDIRSHALGEMLKQNLPLSLCTDNRLISHTSLCREYRLALDHFEISPAKLKEMVLRGFAASFYYNKAQKPHYLEKIRRWYERIEKKYDENSFILGVDLDGRGKRFLQGP
jgi:adenosine deaminase